jgi:hypothetical protein
VVDAAQRALQQVIQEVTPDERAAIVKADRALAEAVAARLERDPRVAAIRKELDEVREQWRAVATRIRDAGAR